MVGSLFRSMCNATLTMNLCNTSTLRTFHTAPVYYAARKGTRAKARAKKVKVEVTKVGFIPHNQRGKDRIVKCNVSKHTDDKHKPPPMDDVYPLKYYRWVVYRAEDAVRAHQQTHHPTMYNAPGALVCARLELDMSAAKKNRFVDSFTRLSLMPNPFPRDEERTILAFAKGPEQVEEALAAGATAAGGADLIKKVQEGQVKPADYDYVLAHPNIITDLVPVRGLMKRRFPNVRAGTLDADLKALVKKFSGGVQYRVVKDDRQENYGSAEVPVGRLNMDPQEVAENIEALLKDLQSVRPKRDGLFITKCLLVSPPSPETLKIDPFVYVDRTLSQEVRDDSDDEQDGAASAAATA